MRLDFLSRRSIVVLSLVAIALPVLAPCGQLFAQSNLDNSLRRKGGLKERYLTVHWPENKQGKQPAITLRVPKEYLHESTTWFDEKGEIKSVAILFELPGPTPWQERPWLKGKKGTPEYEEFMKTWLGKFSMDVGRDTSGGYNRRVSMRNRAQPAEIKNSETTNQYLRDADIAGLERYSTKICYSPEQLKNPSMNKYLGEKPADDPSPENCRLDRLWAILVSPPQVKNDEEGVAIRCMSTGCWAYFSAAGRGITMAISHKDVLQWKKMVEPARELVRSFIVTKQSGSVSTPRLTN